MKDIGSTGLVGNTERHSRKDPPVAAKYFINRGVDEAFDADQKSYLRELMATDPLITTQQWLEKAKLLRQYQLAEGHEIGIDELRQAIRKPQIENFLKGHQLGLSLFGSRLYGHPQKCDWDVILTLVQPLGQPKDASEALSPLHDLHEAFEDQLKAELGTELVEGYVLDPNGIAISVQDTLSNPQNVAPLDIRVLYTPAAYAFYSRPIYMPDNFNLEGMKSGIIALSQQDPILSALIYRSIDGYLQVTEQRRN